MANKADITKSWKAAKAADEIISDLSDRGGIGSEWDQIDEDCKEDIKATWAAIILKAMEN